MAANLSIEGDRTLERKLAAILAADVVGYTSLMGHDEAGTLRRLTQLREQTLQPLISEHHGRVVKLMGDGLEHYPSIPAHILRR
jgi:adenylate cyclase